MPDLIPEDPLQDRLRLRGRLLTDNPKQGYGYVSDVRTEIEFETRRRTAGLSTPPPYYPTVSKEGSGYRVTLAPGAIGYFNGKYTSGLDALQFEVPTLNGQPLNSSPPPSMVVGLDQWVVLEVEVDRQNQIVGTPVVIASDEISLHYLPEHEGLGDDDSEGTVGREGHLYIKLFRLQAVGAAVVPDHRMWSDPILTPYLWGANIKGQGKGKILIKFNVETGKYEFRSIRRGPGVDVIQSEEEIKVKLDAENVGDGNEVYIEAAGDDAKAQFRTIKAHDDGELSTEQQGDTITVRGNSKGGRLNFVRCDGSNAGEITWLDGLITSQDTLEIRIGDCCNEESPGA